MKLSGQFLITLSLLYLAGIGRPSRFDVVDIASYVKVNELSSVVGLGFWQVELLSEKLISETGVLQDCDFLSPDGGWAVGNGYVSIRWDGISWNRHIYSDLRGFRRVKMLAPNDVWAVGSGGRISHWDGQSWNEYPTPPFELAEKEKAPEGFAMNDLFFLSPERAWAVGEIDWMLPDRLLFQNVIFEWDGEAWIARTFQDADDHSGVLTAVGMLDNDGWLGGTNRLYRWQNNSWNLFDKVQIFTTSIYPITANNVWLTGKTEHEVLILHWNGVEWQETYRSNKVQINALTMVSDDFGWAVGGDPNWTEDGNIILHWNGKEWIEVPSPTNLALFAVCAVDEENAWIVGGGEKWGKSQGIVLRYLGPTKISLPPAGTTPNFFTSTPTFDPVNVTATPSYETTTFGADPVDTKITPTQQARNFDPQPNESQLLRVGIGLLFVPMIMLFLIALRKILK